ncbi:GntR family transcriptional regulator [Actinomadura sp. HBU206391]|uniref:GntR family transcriptional regulator n=1 Tax=Actinomadura sp. HBU206391 TaxID=2731692 RepID=UPI001650993F|nr:GntR family transcriptional regulator [Actinomadura sp. HBU206391]MBC6456657.1 GntR family transcriptional regulator [Actinomadura sp. HBU206391]
MFGSGSTVRRVSLRDQALAVIRKALVTGEITSGRVYSAAGLAAELGVSNSPVREAMLSLVDDGLMEVVPNKGFRAVSLSEQDLAEIFEMRMMLEVPATGRAAELGLGDRLPELEELVDRIERTAADGDLTGNLEADRAFHLGLLEATGNRRLVATVTRLRDQTRLHNLGTLAVTGDLVASAAEHRPMLTAVVDGDRAGAEALMRRHLAHIRTDWSGEVP